MVTARADQLAQETADRLLCSEEAIELLVLLRKRNLLNAVTLLERAIEGLFLSERAIEARGVLADLPILTGAQASSPGFPDYRFSWSFTAGIGCPAEEISGFLAALKEETAVNHAMMGHYTTLAATEPAAAVQSALDLVRENSVFSGTMRDVIENLPESADFAQIEQLLPAEASNESLESADGVNSETDRSDPIRRALLREWAKFDPAAAANYVMSAPERLGPKHITPIVATVAIADLHKGLAWVQEFPPGPYYDAAVAGIIPYIVGSTYVTEAEDLASMIEDPILRERAMQRVGRYRSGVNRGQ